jgi:hypothetical protein
MKDDATPPSPLPVFGLRGDIQITGAGAKTGEGRVFSAVNKIEAQHGVEPHGAGHVMRGQGDRTDAFDHRG